MELKKNDTVVKTIIGPIEIKEEKPVINKIKLQDYLIKLEQEKQLIDQDKCPETCKILKDRIHRLKNRGKVLKAGHLFKRQNHRVIDKFYLPKFINGYLLSKLLGIRGQNIRELGLETKTRLSIRGRGSMMDRKKEKELSALLDPKYEHLSEDLHIEIFTQDAPDKAHLHVANAINRLRKLIRNLEAENEMKMNVSSIWSNPNQFPQIEQQKQQQQLVMLLQQQRQNQLRCQSNFQHQCSLLSQFINASISNFPTGGNLIPISNQTSMNNYGPMFNIRNNVRPTPYSNSRLIKREI